MARHKGTNNSSLVESYLRKHAGIACDIGEMEMALGLTRAQVRNAIDYLRNGRQCPVQTVTRGTTWRWGSSVGLRRLAKKPKSGLSNPLEHAPKEPNGPKPVDRTGLRRMVDKLGEAEHAAPLHVMTQFAEDVVNSVPTSKPAVTLKVLGTLAETGEVLVQGSNEQGFESGVWAMRRLG